jgi:hypothetical protein
MIDKIPNFILAGLPKCGTSSMNHYIKNHPQIFVPYRKELHYFTHHLLAKNQNGPGDEKVKEYHTTNWDDYLKHYSQCSNERAIGDISPSYASYPECLEKIRQKLGDIKVIVLIRDPINRAFSNYLHLVREKRETLSFEDALKKEQERQKLGYGDFWRYTYNSFYCDKIKALKNVFSDVMIIPFEDFIDKKELYLIDFFDFIEVNNEYIPQNMNEKFNEGGMVKDNLFTSFLHGRSQIKDFVKKILPIDYSQLKTKVLKKFKEPNPEISENTIQYLTHFFQNDVLRLKEEFNVDISLWRNYKV